MRYNPVEKPHIKSAKWFDFQNGESDEVGIKTEMLLNSAIEQSLSQEKSIAISLSSGIDSTLCLGLIRKAFPQKKIISICGIFDDGFNESIIAKKIAEKFDTDFHIVNMSSIFTNMPEIISITKKPKWNTYTHLIAKKAKQLTNTLVTGDGADELFGGYTFRYGKFLNLLKSDDDWKTKVTKYLECHNRDWVPNQENLFGSAINFRWNVIYNYLKPYFNNELEPLKQVMLADFNGKLLHDFIPMGHEICNHYNIKGNSIFLNPKVISFALKLPIDQKYDIVTQKGKLVLRKIAKRLGIDHIDEKRGFSPSLFFDWNKHGKDICKEYLLQKHAYIYKRKLINPDWVSHAFRIIDDDGDIRYLNRLISVLALEIWFRVVILKEMRSSTKL